MQLNQRKTFTKDEFLTLAKQGLQLRLDNYTFLYDPTHSEPARPDRDEIQGYIIKSPDNYAEHIQGFWNHFLIGKRFTITQLPNIKLLKPRALN